MPCLTRPCVDSKLKALWEPVPYFAGFYSNQVVPSCQSGPCRDTRCQPADSSVRRLGGQRVAQGQGKRLCDFSSWRDARGVVVNVVIESERREN